MALRLILTITMIVYHLMPSSALPHDVIVEMMYPVGHQRHHASPSFLESNPHNPLNISEPCWDAFNRTVNSTIFRLITGNLSVSDFTVADSFGKPGAGILAGNVNMLGHFDECENITSFKYCLSYFNISSVYGSYPFPLMYGLCAPKECQDADVYQLVELTGIGEEAPLESVLCTNHPHLPFDWQFILTVIFFSVLFILVVSTSLYYAWYHSPACHRSGGFSRLEDSSTLVNEGGPQQEPPDYTRGDLAKDGEVAESEPVEVHVQGRTEGTVLNTVNKVLFSFALPQNLPKLLSGKLSKDSIDCLHGIRVISMLWVILGHVFSVVGLMPMINPLSAEEWFQRYGFLTVTNAFFSVDSFFVLSGLLVTYITLKHMKKKNGRIPWRWFYFHRYWRLTPALAIAMLFWIYIVPYFGHGPYTAAMVDRTPCENYWWTNLLYINNFYPVHGSESCIAWVWYLANDMQFFVISPLILIPLYYMPLLGMIFIGILCVASMLVTGILTGIYDFPAASLGFQINPRSHGTFSDVIYSKPYCRITPYLAGMVLGYILYKYPKKSIKIHWAIVLFNWIVACGVGYTCIYSVYPNYNGHVWTTAANVLYESFCRFAWGVSLAWIIFACHYGYGGWVNSLLGHPGWAPLSRLTYCAYLLHPIIIFIYTSNLGAVLYASLNLTAFTFAGVSLISYGCAAIFSLMVEFPLVSLEKLFIPRA